MNTRLLLLCVACLLLGAQVHAQDISYTHSVRPGETLASIAQRYYGKPRFENILVAENGLDIKGGSSVVTGIRLTIPWVRYHRVEEGESWRSIAERFYGNANRAFILIEANPKKKLDEGQQVLIPHPLRHVASLGQTLTEIGRLYYGKKKRSARTLRRFNALRAKRMVQGQVVLVPLSKLKLSKEGRSIIEGSLGVSIATGATRRAQEEINTATPEIEALAKEGFFAKALGRANYLLGGGHASNGQKMALSRIIATCQVALGAHNDAVETFLFMLDTDPNYAPPDIVSSPKLIAAFEQAKTRRSEQTASAKPDAATEAP